jgi:hypothetical protein
MESAPLIVLVAILFIFLFRGMRTSQFGLAEIGLIDQVFSDTRDRTLRFSGEKVEVLFSDMRLDRFAKSSFFETGCPLTALKLCKDKSDRYFLWTYRRPEYTQAKVKLLTKIEAYSLLKNKEEMLAKVFREDI